MEIKSSKYVAIKTLSYCTLLKADRDTGFRAKLIF